MRGTLSALIVCCFASFAAQPASSHAVLPRSFNGTGGFVTHQKCVPPNVKQRFTEVVVELHGALELWPFLKYGCDSGDLSAGVCWIAGEMEALSHDFDAEIYPMINLTCLPCKDLFAPVELISQRLEEMVLRGECRPLINGTLPHSCRADHCTGSTCPTCCGVDGPPIDNRNHGRNSTVCPQEVPTCVGYTGDGGHGGFCNRCGKYYPQLVELVNRVSTIVLDFVASTTCDGPR